MTDRSLALARIAAKALSLSEHLGVASTTTPVDDGLSQARWEAWCLSAANGDSDQFARRLNWDGLDAEAVRRQLGTAKQKPDTDHLPPWTRTLDEVLNAAETLRPDQWPDSLALLPGRTWLLPFQELWQPFVLVAQQRLRSHSAAELLTDVAWQAVDQRLLVRLAEIGGAAMALEFWMARVQQQPSLVFIGQAGLVRQANQAASAEPANRSAYLNFVGGMLNGGLVAFCEEYSALARLLITALEQHVAMISEFLTRLQVDLIDIQHCFSQTVAGRVTSLELGLSDHHQDGRTVISTCFETGLHIIYKPHDLGIEVAYHGLIHWLNERGLKYPLKALNILNRPTHGWVEFVANLPCANQAAVERYFHRIGSLVCLFYVLNGADFHSENVIACADQPVPIDLEVLLNPTIAPDAESDDNTVLYTLIGTEFKQSVLYSGLLPRNVPAGAPDISSLGIGDVPEFKQRVQVWYAINTDRMALIYDEMLIRPEPPTSLPSLNSQQPSARDYMQPIVSGFREMYQLLMTERDELLADESSPLAAFRNVALRFVFRATRTYAQILRSSFEPKYARDGVDRSLRLELLARAYLNTDFKPRIWPVLAHELAALERMDVPLFTIRSSSCALSFEDELTLDSFFVEAGYDLIARALHRLDQRDLARQITYIEASLLPRVGLSVHPTQYSPVRQIPRPAKEDKPLAGDELLNEAVRLGDILKSSALQTNGAANWVALDFRPEADTYVPGALGSSLYGGLAGVALFLAALSRQTGDRDYRALTNAAVKPIRWWLNRATPQHALQAGIGGAGGLCSTVYGLCRIAELCNDDQFVALAEQFAQLVTPELIASDRALDVIGGSAGAILGLSALYAIRPNAALLDKMVLCGRQLLAAQQIDADGQFAWTTLDNQRLTGFSHGAAGITYALLRLYALSGESDFQEAAQRGIAYERSVFAADAGNWPDFRAFSVANAPDRRAFMVSWCHGAPGIGLARIGGLPVLDTNTIRDDINIALQSTINAGLADVDHICCGNLGRADILLTAAQRLARPDLEKAALALASSAVHRARQHSYRLISALASPVVNPGLFNGIAGIGYTLLRLADPEHLPSILSWD